MEVSADKIKGGVPVGKRESTRKSASGRSLPEPLDQLELALKMLPERPSPRSELSDLNRRLSQVSARLSARTVRRVPTRRRPQPGAETLPLFS